MKFGIQHGVGDPAWTPAIFTTRAVTSFTKATEEVGWDAIAFTDHPAPSDRWIAAGGEGVCDPFSALGFCAAITEKLQLMTLVLVPAFRNPFMVAQQLSTLDHISDGRVIAGLGTGYLSSEFHAVGVNPKERLARFDENLAIMREAWTGAAINQDGTGWSARGVKVLPPPVQQPHPPLWIHGNSPWGLERAARYGQGWLGMMTRGNDTIVKTIRSTALHDYETLERRIDELRAATVKHGRDPSEVEISVLGPWPMLDGRRGWDVDQCLADVARLEAMGVGWIVVNCCGDDPGAADDTTRRFGEEIIQASRR
jgi:probable F420-dependent oxidoreductase